MKLNQQQEVSMSDNNEVKPWDFFNKNIEKVLPIISEKRLDICKKCPRYVRFTKQCKECGCLMTAKTKLADSSCPLNKWGKFNSDVPIDRDLTDKELEDMEKK